MADVTITIRRNNDGAETVIQVSGKVADAALAPFTDQLATLLSATANAPIVPPLAPLLPIVDTPTP